MIPNESENVTIINTNMNAIDIVASAGRISTTSGSAEEILKKSKNNINNLDLISKILKSGHKSIIEHLTFNLCFNNVSVFVEQFIIEFRLASFTVQSRRYVDFSDVGYYIPTNLSPEITLKYKNNMDFLFQSYSKLLKLEIPKEDARFILPYCFRSNFYCTCNARELIHIICNMIYGRGSYYPEIVSLGKSLKTQFNAILPNVIEKECQKYNKDKVRFEKPHLLRIPLPTIVESRVDLLSSNLMNIDEILNVSNMNFGNEEASIFSNILHSTRARELELLMYVYKISNISLAALTHLTRHRIQTLLIPNIISAFSSNTYVLPEIIMNNKQAKLVYINAIKANYNCINELLNLNVPIEILPYCVLSGNTLNVISAMNAREFWGFINLRTCNRAQWEIRKIAIKMLNIARQENYNIFKSFGPSCYSTGKCPEGNMSCGKMRNVKKMFKEKNINVL